MSAGCCDSRAWLFESVLAVALSTFAPPGYASPSYASAETHEYATHPIVQTAHQAREAQLATVNQIIRAAARSAAARGEAGPPLVRDVGMSCVPYARNATGIALIGDAWQWWDLATGIYARGGVPEPGSVLAFRANERMPLGHVAVVTRVVNNREIEIDHANWAAGGVARGVPVVDVSENNDWTAVRVGLGSATSFGSIYPTHGFIYDWADSGTMLTAMTVPAVHRTLNPLPRHMRPGPERAAVTADTLNAREYDVVAEAPSHAQTHGVPAARQALNPPPRARRPTPDQAPVIGDTLNAREYDEMAEAPSHPQASGGDSLTKDRE